ncbi:MAG: hypothetical protein ACE5FL_06135 [Myxococcota bacterium]
MNEQASGRERRSLWRVFEIEEAFKQRQILRLLALTALNVAVSTAAFIAFQNHEINALRQAAFAYGESTAPSLVRIAIVWVSLMAATGGLFALLTGLLMTQRMAGPIYKFKDELGRIAAGNAPRPIHLRGRDEFHDVADALNAALETLWSRAEHPVQSGEIALDLEQIRSVHDEILRGLESLDTSPLSEADRSRVETWREQMLQVRNKLDA